MNLIKLLRFNPHNVALFIFGGAVALSVGYSPDLIKFMIGVVIFTLTYSSAYIINDVHDINYDKNHKVPAKRRKPLVTGAVSVKLAKIIAVTLIITGIVSSTLISPLFTATLSWLLAINVVYTYKIKSHYKLIPYWHALITYVKLLSGYSVITASLELTPWTYLLLPSLVYAYFSLMYNSAKSEKSYGTTKEVIITGLIISSIASVLTNPAIGFKIIITTGIAVVISGVAYKHHYNKGLISSYTKSQYLGAGLLWALSLILIA